MASADADAFDAESDDPAALDLNIQVRELPRSDALSEKSAPDPEDRDVQTHLDGADCESGQGRRKGGGGEDYRIIHKQLVYNYL